MLFIHRTFALASLLCYLAALALPAFKVMSDTPIVGWECLIHGWQFSWTWAANLFLFGAWFAYLRKSWLSVYWAVGALGAGGVFTAKCYEDAKFTMLPGHTLWLTSMGMCFVAVVFASVKPRTKATAQPELA